MADVSDADIATVIDHLQRDGSPVYSQRMIAALTELQARRAAEAKAVEVDLPDYLRFGEPDMFPPAQK